MDKNEWICEEEYKPSYHVLKKQLKHNKSLHPSYKQGLKEGLEAAYNQAIDDMTDNLIRNSRTEVIDGKIMLIVTDERIKTIAEKMKNQQNRNLARKWIC